MVRAVPLNLKKRTHTMKEWLRSGVSFGLTSAVITTLGLMVGLHSGTGSKLVVLEGIITIAIADAFSDALGMHISKEAEPGATQRQVWGATFSTLFTKAIFALTFVIPVVLLPLGTAIVASIIWGLFILTLLSYAIAKSNNVSPWNTVVEHVTIALVVIVLTHWIGDGLEKLNNGGEPGKDNTEQTT